MKAIVIGGGIGGAAAALSLLHRGIDVEVYEQAKQMTEIGAGVQMGADATRVLIRLGLGEQLAQRGVLPGRLEFLDLHSDRSFFSAPIGEAATARYGAPYYQLHRPDLLDILVSGLPTDALHLGQRAEGFEQDADGVTVRFASGQETRGDLLVGADGIHSTVRRVLLGEEQPDFARIVAWRALIPRERLSHVDIPTDCLCWLGPGRSGVVYWVHAGELLNFVGMVPSDEAAEESWTAEGEVGALRRSFRGCAPRLWSIVEAIDQPFITGYYFRYPLPKWSEGRVTLLGDAAHPMHPFLAQGACQAIEDGAMLAAVLAAHGGDGVPAALLEYQQRRIDRASRVQDQARTHQHLWHMSDPREIVERNRMLASTMEIDPSSQTLWGWLWGYDAEAEAARPIGDPAAVLKRAEAQRAWRMWRTMISPRDLDNQQHGIRRAYDRFLLENFPADPAVRIERVDAAGVPCVRVGTGAGPVLLHLHGGGYLMGSAEASVGLCARLAAAVDGTCVAVDYRRAPEHPYPAALEDALAAYLWLLDAGVDASRIVLTGESSGGGLALALAMRLRDLRRALPAAIVAMCPMADLTVSGESVDATEGRDPICTRRLLTQMASTYLQTHDPRDPLVSPVYGSYVGLPPLLVQVAENEALYSDAVRVVDAARRDGVEVELDLYQDSVHVFQIFDFLPESASAIRRIGEFVRNA
jgi:salicylate hydroxylase